MTSTDKTSPLALYRTMLVIRMVEERLAKSHQRGLIHGACHTYVGQEAIATAVCAHLDRNDAVFSTHRGHGHALDEAFRGVEIGRRAFQPRGLPVAFGDDKTIRLSYATSMENIEEGLKRLKKFVS